jgi:predicted RNA-binding protein associated with RNAse of E/G family
VRRRPDVHIHYHRPPGRTDLYVQPLVIDDGRVKITFAERVKLSRPVVLAGEVALEEAADAVWFTFPGAWHDIARFHRADGRLSGIYANILTPCVFEAGETWHTTDLFLDLWIPTPSGIWREGPSSPQLLDEDELAHAEREGWIGPPLAAAAKAEAARLTEAARRGEWPPPVVGEWTRERVREALRDERIRHGS